MIYKVFENGRLAELSNWKQGEGFETIEEAALYMLMWAYPISQDDAKQMVPDYAYVGKHDCSTSQFDTIMEIRFV